MSRRNCQLTALLAGVAVALLSHAPARAQTAAPTNPYTPYQHRALYLFNFAKYTEWPPEAFPGTNSPFVLGIVGKDPFGRDVDIIAGKPIKNRRLVVRRFESLREVHGCHLLFLGLSETNGLPEALTELQPSSTLTIAELDGFIPSHGMINLVVEQKSPGFQTIGFEINQAAAERARLKIDPQLLRLARPVPK